MKLNKNFEIEFEDVLNKYLEAKSVGNVNIIDVLDEFVELRKKFKNELVEQIVHDRRILGYNPINFEPIYENPKYLVRPHDFHIWDLDESNGCYRSYITRSVTYGDGTRPNAQSNYTYENLVNNYDFFTITEEELPKYEEKNNYLTDFLIWQCRSDGHGGSKGGSMEEYEEYLKRVERFNKRKENE